MVLYHNTLIAPVRWMLSGVSNIHFRNNLILGRSEAPELFAVDTFTNYSTLRLQRISPERGRAVLVPVDFAAVRRAGGLRRRRA